MLPDFFWRAARLAIGKPAQDWHWERHAGELDDSFLPTACFLHLPVDCSVWCWRPLPYGLSSHSCPTTPRRTTYKPTSIRVCCFLHFWSAWLPVSSPARRP